ncbi:HAD family hydrolase [Chitinimonas sp. PSY-7]|uniref:HAD-IA family hydrolase n=1 Tax=Chitinimonas sp. PSY-7 TaxID=3459088 RepID=UPI00403FEF49
MKINITPAAILFDMDGLMIDSESAVLQCWVEAAAQHGMTLDDELLHAMVGLHEKLAFKLLCERMPESEALVLAHSTDRLYQTRVAAGLPLKAGIMPLLTWLTSLGIPKAVATSTRRDRAEIKLKQSGLIMHFPLVVTGSDIEHPKPAPDIYLLAAKRLGVEPTHCIVLEDSEPGVRAALAAGMTPIQVPDLKQPSEAVRELGHCIVGSLAEAHTLLKPILQPQP